MGVVGIEVAVLVFGLVADGEVGATVVGIDGVDAGADPFVIGGDEDAEDFGFVLIGEGVEGCDGADVVDIFGGIDIEDDLWGGLCEGDLGEESQEK
ncbi:MAG: hypothetical protein RI897_813 [Verrucomicrobiota bacterium]